MISAVNAFGLPGANLQGVGPTSSFAQALGPLIPTDVTSQVGLAPAEKSALGGQAVSFSQILSNQIEQLGALQTVADIKATQAATGDLTDIHDYMIAANQANLATDLTVSVRNKALEAFSEIMRIQI